MPQDGLKDTSTDVAATLRLHSPSPSLVPDSKVLSRRPREVVRAVFQRRHWAVIALIALYVGWFSYLIWKLYYGYGYPPFDLSIFNQGLWLLSHFHIPFVTVMGRNLFGDHTSFILSLFAPFY